MRFTILAAYAALTLLAQQTNDLGLFEGASDVGYPAVQGSATYDPAKKTYRLTGAGTNMWAGKEEFQFVRKRLSGDVSLTAVVHFQEAGGAPHRKAAAAVPEDLPLLGLAHVGIRISDLDKARAFYHGVLGLDEAFATKNADGGVFVAYFKVNDQQFIELFPGLKPDQIIPMTHIAMYTGQLEKLHQMMEDRGVEPTSIKKGPRDGNLSFSIRKLPGQSLGFLEFVQYMPDSLHTKAAGKFLGDRRLSTHLEHAGIICTDVDVAYKFYVETLGFRETWRRSDAQTHRVVLIHLRMPGGSHDYIELSNLSGNNDLTRTRAGTAAHCSLEVPDIKVAYQTTLDRGQKDIKPPRFGLDERWQFNLFDPDGTRVECMQPRDPSKAGTPVPPAFK